MTPKNISLTSSFPESDGKRVDLFLQKLTPNLVNGEYLVVGGLAIRYHLAQHGIAYPARDFNDLDLKADSPRTVLPSVSEDFMIYHYHPLKEGHFFIVLVDPPTKIKVDIFDSTIKDERFIEVPFYRGTIRIVGVEDQLVKSVFDTQRVSEEQKVDPKQFSDTKFLIKIADMKLADEIWKQKKYKNYPSSLSLAIRRAEKIAKEHPEWVKEKPFRRPTPYVCPSCNSTTDFQITPMEKIYKALGYVE